MGIDPPNTPGKSADEILHAIIKESARGCVLVCAAWAEDIMRRILWRELAFIHIVRGIHPVPAKDLDSLLHALLDGALMRSANRVACCRAMGVIDENTAIALNALFSMRHKYFAHFAGPSRLNDPRVSQRLKEFTDHVIKPKDSKPFSSYPENRKQYSKARLRFMDAYADLMIGIFNAMGELEKSRVEECQRLSRLYTTLTRQLEQRTSEVEQSTRKLTNQSQSSRRASRSQITKATKRDSVAKRGHSARKSSGK